MTDTSPQGELQDTPEAQARPKLKDPFTFEERLAMAAAHKRYLDEGGHTLAELSELARAELKAKGLPVAPRT